MSVSPSRPHPNAVWTENQPIKGFGGAGRKSGFVRGIPTVNTAPAIGCCPGMRKKGLTQNKLYILLTSPCQRNVELVLRQPLKTGKEFGDPFRARRKSMYNSFMSKILEAFHSDEQAGGEVVFEGDSQYHHIIIRDEDGLRTMYFGAEGDEAETSINFRQPEKAVFEYPGMMLAALPLNPGGRKIVMLGLGGGYLPGLFRDHLPEYHLTVVELDLLVAELARTYFGFNTGPNVDLVIGDGRDYLERQPLASLDQIWLDAFSGDSVPPQLSGLDFLNLCRERLTPGGLVVQNLHQSRPWTFQNQLKTTAVVFGDNYLALSGRRCGNAIVISRGAGGPEGPAWKKKGALEEAAKKFGRRLGPYDLVEEMRKVKTFVIDRKAEVIRGGE